jgi:hypothetical protein
MAKEVRRSSDPVDRLTRMCDAMTKTFDLHPENRPEDKCMVFLDDGKRGGLVTHGYDDDTAALVDLLMHLQAMFKASGKRLDLMFMDEKGIDRVDG